MSFSSDTKREVCRQEPLKGCCVLAECYGVLLFCNRFAADTIRIATESLDFAQRLEPLLRLSFELSFDTLPDLERTGGKYVFMITDKEKIKRIYDRLGFDWPGSVAHHLNYAVLEQECCRQAFFRGAFLAGGSVTDPKKRYHLELSTGHSFVARELSALLKEEGFLPKEAVRNGSYLVYFKNSEHIEDFLTTIGAPISAMELMNAKVEKSVRGGANRQVNCDEANVEKTVAAAQKQIAAIRRMELAGTLSSLPDKLYQTALLRQEHPELTLAELCLLCDPPITKSALNHRLKRIFELSEQ